MLQGKSTIPGAQGVEADEGLAAKAMALVRTHGEAKAREMLGVDRLLLPRVIARLPVRAGTLALVRESLAKMEAA